MEVEAKTELLVDALADTLAEVEAVTLGKTLENVKDVCLVDTRAEILLERQCEILGVSMALDIQRTGSHAGSVSSKEEWGTHSETLTDEKCKTLGDILFDVNAEPLVDTLSDTVLKTEAETLEVKTGNVYAKTVADTLKK